MHLRRQPNPHSWYHQTRRALHFHHTHGAAPQCADTTCLVPSCAHAGCVGAGRFDGAKAWLLRYEGLLVGGAFMGGLSWMVVKTYLTERVDDIARQA